MGARRHGARVAAPDARERAQHTVGHHRPWCWCHVRHARARLLPLRGGTVVLACWWRLLGRRGGPDDELSGVVPPGVPRPGDPASGGNAARVVKVKAGWRGVGRRHALVCATRTKTKRCSCTCSSTVKRLGRSALVLFPPPERSCRTRRRSGRTNPSASRTSTQTKKSKH